jgi:hypothetical protein
MATDEFDAENAPTFTRSKVDIVLDDLCHVDRQKHDRLFEVLNDPAYTSAAIARVVTKWGHPISQDAVRKWRKRRG